MRAQRVKGRLRWLNGAVPCVNTTLCVYEEKQRSSGETHSYGEVQMFFVVISYRSKRRKGMFGMFVLWMFVEHREEKEIPQSNQAGEFPDCVLFTQRALVTRDLFLFPSEVTKRLWEVTRMRRREYLLAVWLENRVL